MRWKDSNPVETVAAAFGMLPIKSLSFVETDKAALMEEIKKYNGPVILTTRAEEPGFFQRGVQKHTNSVWQHAEICVPYALAKRVREIWPELMDLKESPRWHRPPGYPPVLIGGIPKEPKEFECITSSLLVEIDELQSVTRKGEQVIAWICEDWTEDQKLQIAHEAYSWVGEPYDIFEIGNWIIPFIPNPPAMKVCSTATEKWISAGDPAIIDWMKKYGLNPERIAPRDIANWAYDQNFKALCFNCSFEEYVLSNLY